MTGKANSVHDFAEQIGKKLAAAELLGAEGDVEGSIKLMEEVSPNDSMLCGDKTLKVEDIRKNKAEAEQDYRNSMPASSYQQQKLRVCEVSFKPESTAPDNKDVCKLGLSCLNVASMGWTVLLLSFKQKH